MHLSLCLFLAFLYDTLSLFLSMNNLSFRIFPPFFPFQTFFFPFPYLLISLFPPLYFTSFIFLLFLSIYSLSSFTFLLSFYICLYLDILPFNLSCCFSHCSFHLPIFFIFSFLSLFSSLPFFFLSFLLFINSSILDITSKQNYKNKTSISLYI